MPTDQQIADEAAALRKELATRHADVMTTDEMRAKYEVSGFMAPFVAVTDKQTGKKGSLEFTHMPRFYFGWTADSR